jgi:peptide/nickel transport system permease protein
MRLVRSGVIEVMSMEYIKTARAKGLGERMVVAKHALRNACIPVITVLGLQFGQLLGGAVVTETVFAWPGVASLTVDSIRNQDFPVVQCAVVAVPHHRGRGTSWWICSSASIRASGWA